MKKEVIGGVCVCITVIVILTGLYFTGNLPANPPTTPSPPPLPYQGSLATNWNEYGEPKDLPVGDDFVAISSGTGHFLALRSNGTIECRGSNMYGQCNVPDESDFVAVSAGSEHSLALWPNGTIACWDTDGFNNCDVPDENNFVAISAGYENSLALRSNGTIACWGGNRSGECTIPPEDDFIAISAGWRYGVALRSNGTIACWGEVRDMPPYDDYVAISASYGVPNLALALTSTGELIAWDYYKGWNHYVPTGNDFVDISTAGKNNLALRSDGTIVCWGYESYKCNFSSVQDAIAISAGHQNLAITNPHAEEILAEKWKKTKGRITPKTGGIDLIEPQPSRTPVYPAEYIIDATLPEVPDMVMTYTIDNITSLDEKKCTSYYQFTIQEPESDPYHFIPYKEFQIKTPADAIEEFKTHRFEIIDCCGDLGPVENAEEIVVTDISFVYMNTRDVWNIICLQPFYYFEGYVKKGDNTAPFVYEYIPATENLVEFDFLN